MAQLSTTSMRIMLIEYMEESEENFMEVYTYLNGNLCQCYTFQAKYIIESEDELPEESVKELYDYVFNNKLS